MLVVRVTGECSIAVDGTALSSSASVQFALALVLGTSRGQRVSRDELASLLWPSEDEAAGRHSLRQMLYKLRRMGVETTADGETIVVPTGAVFLDYEDGADDDASALRALSAEGGVSILPSFAPGISEPFSYWLDDFRDRMQAPLRRRLVRLLVTTRQAGDWDVVERLAQNCLRIDPLNEEATLSLAEAMALSGSKSRALRLLDEYLEEVGGEGGTLLAVEALKKRIQRRISDVDPSGRAPTPLIGREYVMQRATLMLRAAVAGDAMGLLLVGPSGIGKSRMIWEIDRLCAVHNVTSIRYTAVPSDGLQNTGMLARVAKRLRTIPGATGASPSALAAVDELLKRAFNDAEAEWSGQPIDDQVFGAAVSELAAAILHERPVCLLVDDVDLLAPRLVEWIATLLTTQRTSPLFVVGACSHESPSLTSVGFQHLALPKLTEDELQSLADSLAIPSTSSAQRRSVSGSILLALSGGIPQIAITVATQLAPLTSATSAAESLQSLARDRIRSLSMRDRHTLAAAAMLSPASDPVTIQRTLGGPLIDTTQAIESLVRTGLAQPRENHSLEITALWRDVVLSEIDSIALALMKRAAADQLANLDCAEEQLIERGWEASRLYGEIGLTALQAHVLRTLATELRTRGLLDAAASIWEHILRVHANHTSQEDVAYSLAQTQAELGQWRRVSDTTQLRGVPTLGAGGIRDTEYGMTLLQLEASCQLLEATSESIAFAQAIASDERAPDRWRIRFALLAARMADNWCLADGLSRSFQTSRAISIVPELEDESDLVALIYHTSQGSLEEAVRLAHRRIERARAFGDIRRIAVACRHATYPLRWIGANEEALNVASDGVHYAAASKDISLHVQCLDTLATLQLDSGKVHQASETLARISQSGFLTLDPRGAVHFAENSAHLAYVSSDFARCVDLAQKCLEEARLELLPRTEGFLLCWALLGSLRLGEKDKADLFARRLEDLWTTSITHIGGFDHIASALYQWRRQTGSSASARDFIDTYTKCVRRRRGAFVLTE